MELTRAIPSREFQTTHIECPTLPNSYRYFEIAGVEFDLAQFLATVLVLNHGQNAREVKELPLCRKRMGGRIILGHFLCFRGHQLKARGGKVG